MSTSTKAAVMTALAGFGGVLAMLALLNASLRSQRSARCPARILLEEAASDVEMAAIVEVAGGVQIVEYIDADPDTAHRLPAVQPVLVPHVKTRQHAVA
jgi:hypothetical protein